MTEIIKAYKQEVPAMRFIGKKYTDKDRGVECKTFGPAWHQWFEKGWFDLLRNHIPKDFINAYAEAEACIGLMSDFDSEIQYRIGYFAPKDTPVPDGFEYVDFPAGNIAVCLVQGKQHEVFFQEANCVKRIEQEGIGKCADWCFERYTNRYSEPNENGDVILDVCFYLL
jgi:predicted transcriptional regulator YdeE